MRADGGAAELAGNDRVVSAGSLVAQRRNAAHIVLVNIAAQQHGVARAGFADLAHQPLAGFGVAVPAVGGLLAVGVFAGGEQRGLHQLAPARGIAGAGGVGLQLLAQPALLFPAQKAAGRVVQGGALLRVHRAGAGLAFGAAGLQITVLPAVEQVQPRQIAPLQAAIQAQTLKAAPQSAGAQRHVFVEGLPGGGAPCKKVSAIPAPILACIVIFYFVVIPDDGPVAGRMGGLEMGIAFVQRIAVAVVLQGLGGAQWLGPGQSLGFGGLGVFIDVVAQKQHQIGRSLRRIGPGGVKAMLPALTGRHGHAQLLRPCLCSRGRAAAARGALGIAMAEAVEIPAVRGQAVDLYVQRVARFGACHAFTLGHDAPKLRVMGHLPVHRQRRQVWRGIAAQIVQRRGQPGPDQNVVGLRVAAGHTQRERVVGQCFIGPGPGGQGAQRCGQAGGNQKAAAFWRRSGEVCKHGDAVVVMLKARAQYGHEQWTIEHWASPCLYVRFNAA